MCLAATSLAVSGFFAERAMEGAPVGLTLFARFFLPLLAIAPLLLTTRFREGLSLEHWRTHLVRAGFLVASQWLFFLYVQKATLLQAVVLYNTGPLFITAYSHFVRKQRTEGPVLFGVVLGFLGVGLTFRAGLLRYDYWALCGILAGLSVAVSQLTLHSSCRREKNGHVMFFTYAVASLLCLGPALLAMPRAPGGLSGALGGAGLASLVVMAAGSIGNQWFRGLAYRCVENASVLSPLIYFSIPVSGALDLVMNGNVPDGATAAGVLLILVAAAWPVGVARWKPRARREALVLTGI